MNPVAAGMVATPEAYPWSSYRWHGWGQPDPLITDHSLYDALGAEGTARQCAYRQLLEHQLPTDALHRIRQSLAYNYPLGNDRFRQQIEAMLGRSVGEARPGRPLQRDRLPII